ncbi:MAG: AzlD domain-containing protein [Lachnospiraceae bacterium]|nr:AzlD domain-containing protein [Lachnospiraceae bacterium]
MIYTYIICMCLTTYLIRMLPLVIFQKKIENRFLNSFLYYVPYACLSAMTLPSIFSSTSSIISAIAALAVAVTLSWRQKSLFTVAAFACITVFVVELFL